MTSDTRVKICGLRDAATMTAAVEAGADYIGFVFVSQSPRSVGLQEARTLAVDLPAGVAKVALTLDADDAELERIVETVPLDMLQLHGHETPERVAEVKDKFGLPVMKAVGVADEGDLAELDRHAAVADQILVDAKPLKAGSLPGGNGLTFDWRLISGRRWSVPWMLAGGLKAENVAEAIRLTGTMQVDVSSGVETTPGHKDPDLISKFISAARIVA